MIIRTQSIVCTLFSPPLLSAAGRSVRLCVAAVISFGESVYCPQVFFQWSLSWRHLWSQYPPRKCAGGTIKLHQHGLCEVGSTLQLHAGCPSAQETCCNYGPKLTELEPITRMLETGETRGASSTTVGLSKQDDKHFS